MKHLVMFGRDIGLLRVNGEDVSLTDLGKAFGDWVGPRRWFVTEDQARILREHIFLDPYRSDAIWTICMMVVVLYKNDTNLRSDLVIEQFAKAVGHDKTWSQNQKAKHTTWVIKYPHELRLLRGKMDNLTVTELGREIGETLKYLGEGLRLGTTFKHKTDLLELLFEYLSDEDVQIILDSLNPEAWREARKRIVEIRKQRAKTITSLKGIYKGHCQLCGSAHGDRFGVELTEVHHIVPFSEQPNNDVSNLMVLCPNCHALVHRAGGIFDRNRLRVMFQNGTIIPMAIPRHLAKSPSTSGEY